MGNRRGIALATAAAWAAIATALTLTTGAPASSGEPVPHCQRVLITTPWRSFEVKACDSGLRQPAPGKQWQWVVDGSSLKDGAVIFGFQIPKQGG